MPSRNTVRHSTSDIEDDLYSSRLDGVWLFGPQAVFIGFVIVTVSAVGSWEVFDHADLLNSLSFVPSTLKILIPVIIWVMMFLVTWDILAAVLGLHAPFLTRFYNELLRDLRAPTACAAALWLANGTLTRTYALDSADIGWVGFSFLFAALLNLWDSRKAITAQEGIAAAVFRIWLKSIILGCLASFLGISLVMGDHIVGGKAIWLQMSILFAGICAFVGSQRMKYFMRTGLLATSPMARAFFNAYGSGLYEATHQMVVAFNREVLMRKKKGSRRREK